MNDYVATTPARSRDDRFHRKYGEWAVVTGASEGIGREFARELAASGLNLVLVARRSALLLALAAELSKAHAIQCRVVPADLSTVDGNTALFEATAGLDVGLLVAAAGFGTSGPFLSGQWRVESEMLAVNCAAVVEQCAYFAKRFAARGRGGIVLLSSLVAFQGTPRAAHYAATKAYIQTLAEGLREELKPLGVDVVASAPGPIDTGFAARANMRMSQALAPAVVARQTLAGLGRRTTVRPGWLSKLLGWSLATAPRGLRVRIMGQVMGGMTSHQNVATAAASSAGR